MRPEQPRPGPRQAGARPCAILAWALPPCEGSVGRTLIITAASRYASSVGPGYAAMSVSRMLARVGRGTLAAVVFAALTSGSVAFAAGQPTATPTAVPDSAHWTAYGFDVI